MEPYVTIKSLLRTEKSILNQPQGRYFFLVDKAANKLQIKQAVEEIYKVKVEEVNTIVTKGKIKRVRHQPGKTPDTKKAYVTLAAGQKIE